MFHSVGGLSCAPYVVNSGVPTLDPVRLRNVLHFFAKRNFSTMTVSAFATCHRAGQIPPRTLVITFDDGFRDNHTYAASIVHELGMKATFYVVPGWLGRRQPAWLHRAAYYFDRHPDRFVEVVEKIAAGRWERFFQVFNSTGSPSRDAFLIFRQALPPQLQRDVLDELARVYGYPPPTRLYMNWKELTDLHRAGMEIGAHSMTHRSLWTLDAPTARKEIVHSKEVLERRLGIEVTSFSYPFGHYLPDHLETVASAGYCCAVTVREHHNDLTTNPYELGRYGMNDLTMTHYGLGAISLNRTEDAVARVNQLLGRNVGYQQNDPEVGIVTRTDDGIEYNTIDAAVVLQ